jgi:hypothetical protein
MAQSIYATFATEHDAERAAGALMDHGVSAQAISFVISDKQMHPTVFHPEQTTGATHSADAVPPPTRPLPGTVTPADVDLPPPPEYRNPLERQMLHLEAPAIRQAATPGYHYDALGAVIPDRPTPHATTVAPEHNLATLPPNTPQEIVLNDHQPHIIDMEQSRTEAADGISTTTAGDAAKGALGGAGIGVGLGILLGIAAVTIPGVGLVAGTGALIAGLAAATGAAGGIAGGVFGYLDDLGIPPDHARLISGQLDTGGVLLNIQVSGTLTEEEIVRILNKYGATSAQGF